MEVAGEPAVGKVCVSVYCGDRAQGFGDRLLCHEVQQDSTAIREKGCFISAFVECDGGPGGMAPCCVAAAASAAAAAAACELLGSAALSSGRHRPRRHAGSVTTWLLEQLRS